jgi:dephospho-CoA kinase
MEIPVYLSDDEAKRLTLIDPAIKKHLIALLGEEIYEAGALNKQRLAAYLFADPTHAETVNGIIHPVVKEDFKRWLSENKSRKIVAIESAILIESGFSSEVDYLVMVYAPLELRVQRVMERDHISRDEVLKRIGAQMDDEIKKESADFLIINDETLPVLPQVLSLIEKLSSMKA